MISLMETEDVLTAWTNVAARATALAAGAQGTDSAQPPANEADQPEEAAREQGSLISTGALPMATNAFFASMATRWMRMARH